jgi:voltage-gated potassium channel
MSPFDFSDKQAIDKTRLRKNWRFRLHEIIFESETRAGRAFDSILWLCNAECATVSWTLIANGPRSWCVLTVFDYSLPKLHLEFAARIDNHRQAPEIVFSFFGLVDICAILPTYLSLLVPGSHFFIVIRTLRLLRIFRIFRLSRYLGEAEVLLSAMRASRFKVTVFLGTVATLVIIMGTMMHLIEGEANGFTSIPGASTGPSDSHHRRVRRPGTQDGSGPGPCLADNDHGLRHTGGAHGE